MSTQSNSVTLPALIMSKTAMLLYAGHGKYARALDSYDL